MILAVLFSTFLLLGLQNHPVATVVIMVLVALRFFAVRSTDAKLALSPKRTAPAATAGKPSVEIAMMNTVQKFDNTAPADATKDQTATSEAVRVNEFTLEELCEIEDGMNDKRFKPGQQVFTLKSKKRCRILLNLSTRNDAPMSHLVQSSLVYQDPHVEHEHGKCMVCSEDDPAILCVMKEHLTQLQLDTSAKEAKKTAAKAFIKQHFVINWSSFYKRNSAEYDAVMGCPLTGSEQHLLAAETTALAVHTLSENWNASDARHQDTLVTLNTNNNNTILQMNTKNSDTISLMNNTMLQMQENQKEMLSLVVEKSEANFATFAATVTGILTPKQKHHRSVTPSKKPTTEGKASRTPTPHTLIPKTPATSKKVKAVPVVERVLKDALPLTKNGSECGNCQRTWINFRFCNHHMHQLEEMTEVVQD